METKHSDYAVDDLVIVNCGWMSHAVFKPDLSDHMGIKLAPPLSNRKLSPSLGLGVLGMPGLVYHMLYFIVSIAGTGGTRHAWVSISDVILYSNNCFIHIPTSNLMLEKVLKVKKL